MLADVLRIASAWHPGLADHNSNPHSYTRCITLYASCQHATKVAVKWPRLDQRPRNWAVCCLLQDS